MLAGIVLIVGPIGYAASGTVGLVFGLGAGLALGLVFGLGAGLALGLGAGLDFGLGAGLGAGLALGLGFGFGTGLGTGLVLGLVLGLIGGLGAGLVLGLGAGLVLGLVLGLIGGLGAGLVLGLGAGLGVGLGARIGARIGVLLRSGLREGFTDFPNLWPYLRLMGRPLLGYTWGYAAIVVWFASVYASLYAVNLHVCGVQHQVIPCNAAFSGISTPHFGDFLFFAVTIFPPIGAYSDLHPLGLWAHALVAGELIVGVGYTTVVFAAILAYRTPAFGKLAKNKEPSTEEMIANLKTDLCRAQEQTHTDLTCLDKRMARIESRLEELTK